MKSKKLLIVLVVVMGLVLMATANAEYRTLRQDRPVIVLEDHPWGGEVTGGGEISADKLIINEFIGTPFSFINNIIIIVEVNNADDGDNNNGLLPDDFGSNGGNHNGLKGN